MATYNSSSATSSYPLPHADNPLNVDVGRLITAIEKIDGDVSARLPIASYTAADVLVKVKTVDGAGSGLDADTLDGQHAVSFAPASHSHANATTGAAGFMAATDKAKLDGMGTGANVISVNAKTGAVTLDYGDVGAASSGHSHADATPSTSGYMPAAALTKLNGIGANANVISVNAKTGVVTLDYGDVGAASSGHSHANATTGAAGFMAATDKAKLDGITSATYIATGGIYSSSDKVIGLSNNANIANNPHNFYEVKGSGGAAALAFYRPGAFAGFLGIDNDNQWKVGGWSYGAVSYKIWHQGNDGAGSGLDADTLDGQHAASFAPASHSHAGGEVPVVKSIQNALVNFSGAGTQNVAISSVNTTKSMIVFNGSHMGGGTLLYVQASLTSATNLQISATGAVGNVRLQVVEFY